MHTDQEPPQSETPALHTDTGVSTESPAAATTIVLDEDTLPSDECCPLTDTVDLESPEYKQTIIGVCVRRSHKAILKDEEEFDVLTADRILEGLKRHTVLGCVPTQGSGIPVVNPDDVVNVLSSWKIPVWDSQLGLAWDLAFVNATAHEKAAAQVFIWGAGFVDLKAA